MDTFRINALETENVNPTLEEVSKFAMEGEDGASLDLQKLQASIVGVASDYLPGDDVELFKGEQKGVFGRAVEVYGDVVKMRVDSKGPLRGQTIEAPIKDLRKLFREGDHIKVIGGQYINEVGMVVQVNRKDVTILTDSNQQEIKVFPKDLRVATDSGGNVTGSKYSLFDLVQLDASTVACVIKVDRESLRIMDQTGSVRPILPSAISNKIESKRQSAVATDRNGNEMKVDDVIKEFGGEQKQGRVLHLHRNFVFAQNRERAENAGVFVARHANVVTVAAKGGRLSNQNGIDLTKMNPAMKQNGAPGGGPMPPPQQKGRDRLIGKTVKIKVGQQKGMLGIVKDAGDTSAKVELHGKNKQITISRDSLMAVDPRTGQPLPDNRQPPGMAGRTPAPGSYGRTPFGAGGVGGRTPAYAMATGGGRTPAWKQDVGARTPAYGGGTAYGGGFGGATPYGGATSYGGGSVWGGNVSLRISSSPTRAYESSQQSTWNPNPSSRTPLHNPGNKTPAYSGGLEAPTPGFNSAPTPGNYGDQPTPGGFRESGQYRTPAAYQTPGGFPETPGAGYDEDGPKYD
jgi:transcription elongation factor SPT5